MANSDLEIGAQNDLDLNSSEPLPLWEDYINKPKKESWKIARLLNENRSAEFMTPEDIINLANKYKNPRDACLFVIAYITAGRIEEIVRHQKIRWGKKIMRFRKENSTKILIKNMQDYKKRNIIGILKSSMKREDISEEENKGKSILKIRMRNLKNKQVGEQSKIIPFPLNDSISLQMKKIIDDYINTKEPEEELFSIGKRRAEKIISESKMNPHFLRKLRLTHLVKYYNFSDQKLKTFAGWTDSRPSKHYIKINWQDLVDSM